MTSTASANLAYFGVAVLELQSRVVRSESLIIQRTMRRLNNTSSTIAIEQPNHRARIGKYRRPTIDWAGAR